jgi:SecD/SecF fusion protein
MPEPHARKLWLWLLIGGALLAAAFVVLSVVAFLALPLLTNALGLRPAGHGVVLIYEIDRSKMGPGEMVDMDVLLRAIARRVNPGGLKEIIVRSYGMERIEIIVPGAQRAELERIERLIGRNGALEFRILANTRDNKDLIDRASADPSKTGVHDKKGKLVAWWVPVKTAEERSLAGPDDAGIARRIRKQDGREITEVLVLNDVYNVPGVYITNAGRSEDRQGRPCVIFHLNKVGGKLLGEFTASHLPDKSTGFTYRLGIILDGELLSAPSIQGTIFDSGEITGSFTQQEVQDLVTVLNCGRMPAQIRLVETRAAR